MLSRPDKEIEYLVRRFTLEKGFVVAGDLDENEQPVASDVDPSRFGYDLPVAHIPEIEPLRKHFAVVLVRADGLSFTALGVRKYDGRSVASDLPLEEVLDVGESCLAYTGTTSGAKMPVHIDLLEIHTKEPGAESVQQLGALQHTHATDAEVIVSTYSVGWGARTVQSGGGLWSRASGREGYLRRILKSTDEPEHRMVERVENAGLDPLPILAGAVAGVILAFALRLVLGTLGAEDGRWFGMADYFGSFLAIGIAVYARRIRVLSVIQAMLGSICYGLLLYGGLVLGFGAPFSFWMPVNGLAFASFAYYIGLETEMA